MKSLSNRLAKMNVRAAAPRRTWTERTPFEMPERARYGIDVRGHQKSLLEPLKLVQSARKIVFVDFCPGGVVCNRQDVAWVQQSICTYESFANDEQWELFQSISIGDLLVMKKSQQFSKTMLLHAYGHVFGFDFSDNRDRVLFVDWTYEQGQIEVPLLERDEMVVCCDQDAIATSMPAAFWDWLK